MEFIIRILKKILIFSFFESETNDDFVGEEELNTSKLNDLTEKDNNNQQVNQQVNQQEKITNKLEKNKISYYKIVTVLIIFLGFLYINVYTGTSIDFKTEELQVLLDQLVEIVNSDLFRDIFSNIQKILDDPQAKNVNLYVLKEIHSFFLTDSSRVTDSEEFNRIMKKIIKILSTFF
uniref:Orf176 n=1 Tax=Phytophthora ramorum TaxID=164328 RepID=A4ZHC3_PHYRM|nr:orf176 [Phytophthora ramorum]YP_001165358.1 orf176 [Phytophthora ramorum]ABG54093.1 orf176 [Phytophthora ramorum]ABG54109.1 orf176 [Phytophthora ramorum]ACD46610.1 Orf176 [Phytophthora ramorum]ACD46625.1 Orf176 [Phytophthora ramorum]